MDRVRIIIGYEWRAYWRRFIRGGLRAGNQGIILILALVVAVKYLQLLRTASANISNGNTRLLGSLLSAVFLTWLFPLAADKRETIASREWLHLPIAFHERFIVRAASLMLAPSAWLVVACSVALAYPLSYARHPVTGVVAGLVFSATAWLTGLTIAHFLNSVFWRRLLWFAGLASLAGAGAYLINGGSPRSLLSIQFFPALLVERAAMGAAPDQTSTSSLVALAGLATLLVAAGAAALWSFKKSLVAGPEPASEKLFSLTSNFLPGPLAGLVAKDFRYFRRLLDIYLGLAAAILACLYLLLDDAPSPGIVWSFIVIVLLCDCALAFNGFGLDNRKGMARYALMPVSGKAILLSKNLAFFMIGLAQILPMLIIAAWRIGVGVSALGLVEAATISAAYLSWGNWMSVNHPLKMQFFRFANSGAALFDAMGGIIFGSLPGILLIYLWQSGGRGAVGMTVLTVFLMGAIYLLSLRRFGRRFELKREQIGEALT